MRGLLLIAACAMLVCAAPATETTTTAAAATTTTALFDYRQVIACTLDGRVHSLDPGTGAVRWSLELPASDALFSAGSSTAASAAAAAVPSAAAAVPALVPSVDGALYAYVAPRGGGGDGEEHTGIVHAPLVRRLPVTVPEIVARAPFTGPDGALYLGDRQSVVFAVDSVRGAVRSVLSPQQAAVAASAGAAKPPPGEFRIGRVDYAVRALDPHSARELWNVTAARFIDLQQRVLAWSDVAPGDGVSASALRMVAATDGAVSLLQQGSSDDDAVWTAVLSAPVIAAYELLPDMRLERIHLAYGAREPGRPVALSEGVQVASFNGQLFAVPSLLDAQSHMPTWWQVPPALPLPPKPEQRLVIPPGDGSSVDSGTRKEELVSGVKTAVMPVAVALTAVVFGSAAAVISWAVAKRRYLAKGAATATAAASFSPSSADQQPSEKAPESPTAGQQSSPLPPLPPVPQQDGGSSGGGEGGGGGQPSEVEAPAQPPQKQSPSPQPVVTASVSPPLAAIPSTSPTGRRSVRVGKMEVHANNVLGRGSVGTVVFEGRLEGRRIAVKRLLKEFYSIAQREVGLLQESDEHPNLVRYFTTEEDADFVYLGLTYCTGTLADWVEQHTAASGGRFEAVVDADVMRLMQDIAAGVQHIHSLNIVHRDLKPQNILLDLRGRARISDMGLAKKFEGTHFSYSIGNAGSAGWMAPETLALHAKGSIAGASMTPAMDIFALGCIFHYMVTGQHPFGDRIERDSNILSGNADLSPLWTQPELLDLIEAMLQPAPASRPRAEEVLAHPFFWNAGRKLQFMLAASDRLEVEKPTAKIVVDFEAQVAPRARLADWDQRLDATLLDDLTHHRKYKYDAARDLLRVFRNKANHYYDLPAPVRKTLGTLPDGFVDYFSQRFPALLVSTYRFLLETCSREPVFASFFPQ